MDISSELANKNIIEAFLNELPEKRNYSLCGEPVFFPLANDSDPWDACAFDENLQSENLQSERIGQIGLWQSDTMEVFLFVIGKDPFEVDQQNAPEVVNAFYQVSFAEQQLDSFLNRREPNGHFVYFPPGDAILFVQNDQCVQRLQLESEPKQFADCDKHEFLESRMTYSWADTEEVSYRGGNPTW